MIPIAVTTGDPAGIGPEIVLKALAAEADLDGLLVRVFGDATVLYETCRQMGQPFRLPVVPLASSDHGLPPEHCIVDCACTCGRLHTGLECAEYGLASMRYIEAAVTACRRGDTRALVTGPINKKAIHLAGYDFPGHTEFLASLTGTPNVLMSFHTHGVWTVLTTTHIPLAEALRQVRKDRIVAVVRLAHDALSRVCPRLAFAVASVNPHGAEGGLFGMEESLEIAPAIQECQALGLPVSGPYPADTIHLRASRGEFNVVVTHYHDQGMTPVKLLSFGKAVNVTLGLPFPRTSVDHGTAFDIAGTGRASAESMTEAVRLAGQLVACGGVGSSGTG